MSVKLKQSTITKTWDKFYKIKQQKFGCQSYESSTMTNLYACVFRPPLRNFHILSLEEI